MSKSHYIVPSKEEREVVYHVDVEVGICTCPHGQDGSPCSHQAAVVLHFGCASVNFIPILNPEGKRSLAIIAYGEDAVQDLMFYSTLSQPKPTATQQVTDSSQLDFSASCWDHFRMGEMNEKHTQQSELCRRIDVITDDMKKRLMADTIFQQSAEKFVTTYVKLSSEPTSAHITSALHKFGWCYGGTITSQQGGVLRRSRRIPIQVKSAGRRTISRGKAQTPPGRAPSSTYKKAVTISDKYILPVRKINSIYSKRPHSLQQSVKQGKQDAGKW